MALTLAKITKAAKSAMASKLFKHKGYVKKNAPDPILRCKFAFKSLRRSDMFKTYEGDEEVWTSVFLKRFPEYREASNSRHLLCHFTDQPEVFFKNSTDDMKKKLKPGFRELYDWIHADEAVYENFLNSKHQTVKEGFFKFLACLLYVFQQDGVDVIRVPRDHYSAFGKYGFDQTSMDLVQSYLIARNFCYTTVGQKFAKEAVCKGYFDGRTGYVPSFIMFTLTGIKMMQKLAKKARKTKRKLRILGREVNQFSSDYAPMKNTKMWQNGSDATHHAMLNHLSLWATEDEAIEMAPALSIQYNNVEDLRRFYHFCRRIICRCGYEYVKAVRSIAHHLGDFWKIECEDGLWVKDGSLSRFVKYLIFGKSEFGIKEFGFYISK